MESFKPLSVATQVGSDAHRFRAHMLTTSGAHACAVKHSHEGKGLRVQRRFASLIDKDNLERYIGTIDRRRKRLMMSLARFQEVGSSSMLRKNSEQLLKDIKDQYPPPSRFWKALKRLDLLTNSRCHALIIGADVETTRHLGKTCLVAAWPPGLQVLSPSSLLTSVVDITLNHPTLEGLKPIDFSLPYKPDLEVVGPDDCRALLANLTTTASYFLQPGLDGSPVSVLSIPIPLKYTPWAGPSDFLSVELYWFGKPITLGEDEFEHLIACANYIAPRLIFDPSRNEIVQFVEALAADIKRWDGIGHGPEDWQLNYKTLLVPYPQFKVRPDLLNYLGTPMFHGGMELIHRLNERHVSLRRPLRLHSLWARTVCHLLYHNVEGATFFAETTTDLLELCSFDGCDIDVLAWHEFIDVFNREAESKTVSPLLINRVTLEGASLTVYFCPHPKRNMGGRSDLSHFRSLIHDAARTRQLPDDHQALHAFFNAVLKLNGSIESENERDKLTISISPKNSQDGMTTLTMTDSSLVITLTPPHIHDYYRFRGDDCVFILDEDYRRAEYLGQALTKLGNEVEHMDLARMRSRREVPKCLLAHARDLKSLFVSDAQLLDNWSALSPTIIAYTGDSQAPLRRVEREIGLLPNWAQGRVMKYESPVRVDVLPEHEVRRLSEAISGKIPLAPVLHTLRLRNYPSVLLLLQSLCLLEVGTTLRRADLGESQLQKVDRIHSALLKQLATLEDQEVISAEFCEEFLQETRMCLVPKDWTRVVRAVSASSDLSRGESTPAPAELADIVSDFIEDATKATRSERWSHRSLLQVAVLHAHDIGIMRPALATSFENAGIDVDFVDIHSQFSLPPPQQDIVLVRTEAFRGVSEMNMLLVLDEEYSKRYARKLFVLDLIGTASPIWQYFARCGGAICRPNDFFSVFLSHESGNFIASEMEASDDIRELIRSYIEHEFDAKQYANNLRNIMPWLKTLKRNHHA